MKRFYTLVLSVSIVFTACSSAKTEPVTAAEDLGYSESYGYYDFYEPGYFDDRHHHDDWFFDYYDFGSRDHDYWYNDYWYDDHWW